MTASDPSPPVSFARRLIPPVAVVALVLVILRLAPLPLGHIFVVLTMALLIAAAVAPAADALNRRLRVPRGLAILLIYVVALLALAAVIAVAVPLVMDEIQLLRRRLPEYDRDLQRLLDRAGVDEPERYSGAHLVEQLGEELSHGLGRATGFAVSLSGGLVRVVIVVVLGYFLAAERDLAKRAVVRFVPEASRGRVLGLLERIGARLGQWARAQLLLAALFGIAFGSGLRLAGIPYAATLGATGAVLEIVPYVGGVVTLALALLVALTEGPVAVAAVLVVYTVVVLLESHIAEPYLMGRAVGFNPLVVVVALFVGVEALGVFGALLAVPIAVVIQATLDEFYPMGESGVGSGES